MQTPTIVVAERRWAFVGLLTEVPDPANPTLIIDQASVLHRWGTSEGIGELRKGPKKGTKLNPVGRVHLPASSCLFTMKVDPNPWKGVFPGVEFPPQSPEPPEFQEDPIRILMIPGRWALLGRHRIESDPGRPGRMVHRLNSGFVVRWWGTSYGIGELTAGKTSSTVLDRITGVSIPEVGFVIDVDQKAWAKEIQDSWGKE